MNMEDFLFIEKNIIIVEVPIESTDYNIDDFLGNALQYKINDKWIYDTSIKLPICDLEIIGIEENIYNHDLSIDKKWLKVKLV